MFSSIRSFVKRHQRKFIIGSAIFGGIIFVTRYAQHKIREWQQKEIRAILERSRKQNHFEHLEKTCNEMTMSLALNLRSAIIKELDGQTIINELKHGSGDKIALWNKLKVVSITRSAVIIYAYTMLVTFLRIQIHLISGYMYQNLAMGNTEEGDVPKAKYLQLSSHFIYKGIQKLCNIVKSKVEQVTASISLDNKLTLRDLEQIYWGITSSVFADTSNDPVKNFSSYIIPQKPNKDSETSAYIALLDQTFDLLESEEIQSLTQRNIRSGFVSLIDHISEYFGAASKTKNGIYPGTSSQDNPTLMHSKEAVVMNNGTSEFLDINKSTMPMAKIIPIIMGQIPDKPTPKDTSAKLLEYLMANHEIKMLGANIYEAFSCKTYA